MGSRSLSLEEPTKPGPGPTKKFRGTTLRLLVGLDSERIGIAEVKRLRLLFESFQFTETTLERPGLRSRLTQPLDTRKGIFLVYIFPKLNSVLPFLPPLSEIYHEVV